MRYRGLTELARRVISSWEDPTSNWIIIAPPLVPPRPFFQLLTDAEFQKSILKEPSKPLVALVWENEYADCREFVSQVCRGWDEPLENADWTNPLLILENVTHDVTERGRFPVILLPRFHKAVERLPQNLGATLRALEHDISLRTVVQTPISLNDLFDRWENEPEKCSFLCSRFGQGHNTRVIPGMDRDEVIELLSQYGISIEVSGEINDWTGGLPDLVNWAATECSGISDPTKVGEVMGRGCDQCSKLLNWADPPGGDALKYEIAQRFLGSFQDDGFSALGSHHWAPLFLDNDGRLCVRLLGMASLNILRERERSSDLKLGEPEYPETCVKPLPELLSSPESRLLEFKETLRRDAKTGKKAHYIKHAVLKSVAAFLNTDGGTLLVGVDDSGNALGLAADGFLSRSGVLDTDKVLLCISEMINTSFGCRFARYVRTRIDDSSGPGREVLELNALSLLNLHT